MDEKDIVRNDERERVTVFVDKEVTGGFRKGEGVRVMMIWEGELGRGLTVSELGMLVVLG